MNLINKSICLRAISAFILTASIHAGYLPTIELPMGEELVSDLCFDSGYIREKNFVNKSNVKRILNKTILKFADGSEFIKNDFIVSEFSFYNPSTKKFEKQRVTECESQLIEESFNVEEKHREASNTETIFYGNLKNYGVNDTAFEKWKKWGSLEKFLKYSAEKDRVTLVQDFSTLSEQSQLNDFIAWRDLSGKVLGGEQSGGGGAGKVRVNMNMTAKELKRYSPKPNALERLFGATTFFDRIVYDNKKVSKSQIYVTVPKE